MVRLFVGGLPLGFTPDDMRQRFQPFGEVTECTIAAPKIYGTDAIFPRYFGHFELQPKNEASLRKCIAAYNGSKYKGKVLRVAEAHQHFAERMLQEEELQAAADCRGSGSGSNDQPARTLPQLGPGTVLRLKPPKSPAVVEVVLGSGHMHHHFPESLPSPSGGAAQRQPTWEPLDAPPASGYLFEQHLQRLAADLPPQLLALVEERRRRGKELRAAHERQLEEAAGVEVAYKYSDNSQGSTSLQLSSDDDAATAAAAAAAAITSRKRRHAASATGTKPKGRSATESRQHEKQQRQRRKDAAPQPKLRVVDVLQGSGQDQAQPMTADRAADMSRFDSDSDAEWVGPPAAAARSTRLPLPPPQLLPARHAAQAQQQQMQQPAAVQKLDAELPLGSSGSSGGSELEEWLAAGCEVGSDGAASDPLARHPDGGCLSGEASSRSSGSSELEEFLAAAECDGTAPAPADVVAGQQVDEGIADKAASAGAKGGSSSSDGEGGGKEPVAPPPTSGQQRGQRLLRQPEGASQKQQTIVDCIEGPEEAAMGRLCWQKPAPTVDLGRFASNSDEEDGRPAARPAAAGRFKRQMEQSQQSKQQQQRGKKHHLERLIPQVDGAADSEDAASSSGKDDSSSAESSGSEGTSSSSGSGSGEDGSSGSESEHGDEEKEVAGKQQNQQEEGEGAEAAPAESSEGDSSSIEGKEHEGEAEAVDDSAMVAASAVLEQQRRLAALFPEGALFRLNEPLAQIEATWRVSRESWVQDYRQKHRQALRMMGRSSGGGGKRQRKN